MFFFESQHIALPECRGIAVLEGKDIAHLESQDIALLACQGTNLLDALVSVPRPSRAGAHPLTFLADPTYFFCTNVKRSQGLFTLVQL